MFTVKRELHIAGNVEVEFKTPRDTVIPADKVFRMIKQYMGCYFFHLKIKITSTECQVPIS